MDWGDIISNALRAGVSREAAVFAIAAMGLNIQFGFTGLLNFGQVGFMAIGAYGVGISITYYGWNPVVALIVGILCCIGLALVLGLPALRLRADYLAIVTIAASEIIRTVMRSVSLREFSGGSNGINGFSRGFYAWNPFDPQIRYGFGPFRFFGEQLWLILIGWVIVLVVTLVTFALMRAPWGRVVRSVREDEDAARALGKNAYGYKVQSLIIGGVMGGLGGMVLAIGTQTVQPDSYSPPITFFLYTALILGGLGRVWTPIVGSIFFWMLLSLTDNFLREAVDNRFLGINHIMDGVQVGQVRFMLVGVGLALLMVFRPQGLFGNKQEMALEV
ncbi:MAG TPA: branched-chain amino acid ABC transporter permease [Acidimicrobiales bacterium]|nr:branched-chain amino acid ABC transporter permease [Acidimicrobiales bacterium]